MKTESFDQFNFSHEGIRFTARVYADCDMGEPWEVHDGHGPVSDWTRRDKRPGERVLCEDRGSFRYYDVQAATEIARRHGWGVAPGWRDGFGPEPTKGEIAAEAVRRDFEHLRAWCSGGWHWCGVGVAPEGEEDDSVFYANALWGIESDGGDYIRETACELAGDLVYARREAWRKALHEARERKYWAARDVATSGAES